jgi:hypothetical protein
MKNFSNAFIVLSQLGLSFLSHACPTCVGRIKAESPPFFSADFYQPNQSISRETKEQIGQTQFKKLIESKRGKK